MTVGHAWYSKLRKVAIGLHIPNLATVHATLMGHNYDQAMQFIL